MINKYEVIETNNMVAHENLDVRTITIGISLMECIDSDLNKLSLTQGNNIARRTTCDSRRATLHAHHGQTQKDAPETSVKTQRQVQLEVLYSWLSDPDQEGPYAREPLSQKQLGEWH